MLHLGPYLQGCGERRGGRVALWPRSRPWQANPLLDGSIGEKETRQGHTPTAHDAWWSSWLASCKCWSNPHGVLQAEHSEVANLWRGLWAMSNHVIANLASVDFSHCPSEFWASGGLMLAVSRLKLMDSTHPLPLAAWILIGSMRMVLRRVRGSTQSPILQTRARGR